MITILDQYEIEYKETYVSGTYDQVVMGKMFYPVKQNGITKYIYGDRGVVYGSINSNQSPPPGTGLIDKNYSISYRSQPYKEKAGNCRAAKHTCFEERIYDTLLPDAISCFKINGAEPATITSSYQHNPGLTRLPGYSGVEGETNSFLMFDNYTSNLLNARSVLNPIVDKIWTSSFPFEPRYQDIKRSLNQNLKKVQPKYNVSFSVNKRAVLSSTAAEGPAGGLILGTFGPKPTFKGEINPKRIISSGTQGIYHHWFVDTDLSRQYTDFVNFFSATGSMGYEDTLKVIFGFGDATTIHWDTDFADTGDSTGYQRRGTNNLPTFRITTPTIYNSAYNSASPATHIYEQITGSLWCVSPIIRGWKYGIYNGLPDYTSAYFRQGRYGQYRDMLEQRRYTISTDPSTNQLSDAVITVKFVDQNDNLVNPETTQSQNLSYFATSSLPYFDLVQKNRTKSDLNNLSLMNMSVDNNNNLMV